MQSYLNIRAKATERVAVSADAYRTYTSIRIGVPAFEGDVHFGEPLYIDGTAADRATFLRHMAEQLTAAADHLDSEQAVAS